MVLHAGMRKHAGLASSASARTSAVQPPGFPSTHFDASIVGKKSTNADDDKELEAEEEMEEDDVAAGLIVLARFVARPAALFDLELTEDF